ncbi:hypothetical protein PR202_ga30551 [Eleusine coracana subsp. coracana]|uniref:Uncharacterized protein n=1 Tax=Eleusine coracana subsp. coracana TaxID=191504 RepID=A0AAV5DML9_ELECO|nr:hypothetical protein PR202_ga30551 [Eleusine coracana subsp. coracana]
MCCVHFHDVTMDMEMVEASRVAQACTFLLASLFQWTHWVSRGKVILVNCNGAVQIDKMLECLIEGVCRFAAAGTQQDAPKLPNLNVNNEEHKEIDTFDFGYLIVFMHIRTETYLDKTAKPEPHLDSEGVTRCPDAPVEEWTDKDAAVEVCRKLSYYMMHLLVNHPSLLPLSGSAADALKRRDIFFTVVSENYRFNPSAAKETVEEIKEVWIRLIIYAAAKSRPEMHAVLLARGGEPLTFVWLLLSLHGMGDLGRTRIELAGRRPGSLLRYAFEFDG